MLKLPSVLTSRNAIVTVLGVVAVTTFETETVVEMKPGMTVEAGAYQALLGRLREKGFDLTRLEPTAQTGKSD